MLDLGSYPRSDRTADSFLLSIRSRMGTPLSVLLHSTSYMSDPTLKFSQMPSAACRKRPRPKESSSHMNFYICNGTVVVPIAGVKSEARRR